MLPSELYLNDWKTLQWQFRHYLQGVDRHKQVLLPPSHFQNNPILWNGKSDT